jgi:polyhydroxyalkanoate synthesis regulator protein
MHSTDITKAILRQFDTKALKFDKDSKLSIMSTERLVFLIGFRGHDLQMLMYVAFLTLWPCTWTFK